MSRFWNGFLFLLKGLRASRQVPRIRFWIWTPFAISTIIFISLLSVGTQKMFELLASLTSQYLNFGGEVVLSILLVVMFIFAALTMFVLSGYLVYAVMSILHSPFYAVLAERVLVHRGVAINPTDTFSEWVQMTARMLWVSLRRVVLLGLVFAALFVMAFIPGLNLAAAWAGFVILGFDIADFSYEARRLGLSGRLKDFRENILEYFGMGTALALTAVVPGLILLITPYAVIGAAELQYERINRKTDA